MTGPPYGIDLAGDFRCIDDIGALPQVLYQRSDCGFRRIFFSFVFFLQILHPVRQPNHDVNLSHSAPCCRQSPWRSMRIRWKWNQRYVYLYNICCRSYMWWSEIHEAHQDIWESSRLTRPYPHTVQATWNWRETLFCLGPYCRTRQRSGSKNRVYMVLPLNTQAERGREVGTWEHFHLTNTGIPMIKMRRSRSRLVFMMEILISDKTVFILKRTQEVFLNQ